MKSLESEPATIGDVTLEKRERHLVVLFQVLCLQLERICSKRTCGQLAHSLKQAGCLRAALHCSCIDMQANHMTRYSLQNTLYRLTLSISNGATAFKVNRILYNLNEL